MAKHIREKAIEASHPALSRMGKSGLHNILSKVDVKAHKTAYYLERRDSEYEEKIAQVLVVYKEVQQRREEGFQGEQNNHTVLSYDEKPGIQTIANIAPDLAPVPGKYAGWGRDYEYKRHGTVSLLAGIDLYDGHVLGLVRDRHRSREFIEFLAMADSYYPSDWKLRIILDNPPIIFPKKQWLGLKGNPTVSNLYIPDRKSVV